MNPATVRPGADLNHGDRMHVTPRRVCLGLTLRWVLGWRLPHALHPTGLQRLEGLASEEMQTLEDSCWQISGDNCSRLKTM